MEDMQMDKQEIDPEDPTTWPEAARASTRGWASMVSDALATEVGRGETEVSEWIPFYMFAIRAGGWPLFAPVLDGASNTVVPQASEDHGMDVE
jgi:hypothetical protein